MKVNHFYGVASMFRVAIDQVVLKCAIATLLAIRYGRTFKLFATGNF